MNLWGVAVERLEHTATMTGGGEMTVYSAFTSEGELLYIGKTRNLTNRMRRHRGDRKWWEFAGVLRTVDGLTWDEATDVEVALIKSLAPLFNQAHKTGAAFTAEHQYEKEGASHAARTRFVLGVEPAHVSGRPLLRTPAAGHNRKALMT